MQLLPDRSKRRRSPGCAATSRGKRKVRPRRSCLPRWAGEQLRLGISLAPGRALGRKRDGFPPLLAGFSPVPPASPPLPASFPQFWPLLSQFSCFPRTLCPAFPPVLSSFPWFSRLAGWRSPRGVLSSVSSPGGCFRLPRLTGSISAPSFHRCSFWALLSPWSQHSCSAPWWQL